MAALQKYRATWNDEDVSIATVVDKITAGTYPDSLSISHESYGTIRLGRPGLYGSDYTVSRSGPPLPGLGVSRSYANTGLNEAHLLDYIHEVFRGLQEDLGVRNIARQKLLRLQLEGATKMANASEKNVPKEVRNRIAQLMGEKKPVTGSNTVLTNFGKIKTNLFEGGKRRKTRRQQKKRKATRKH